MTPSIEASRVSELLDAIRPGTQPPKPGCVEGAIGNAYQASAYHTGNEPDAVHVASYLLRSLARNHCYEDGNKRAAWLACLEVLAIMMDVTIDVDQREAADFVENVATGAVDVLTIAHWIAAHLVELQ